MPGWTNTGDTTAAYIVYSGSRTGWGRLGHWLATPYTVTTSQVIAPIPNGTYQFSIWASRDSSTAFEQYLFARNCGTTEVTQSTAAAGTSGWTEIVLSGIQVTNQSCEVGIYSHDATGGMWANFDDATFTKL